MHIEWKDPDGTVLRIGELLRQQAGGLRAIPETAVRRGTFELLALMKDKSNGISPIGQYPPWLKRGGGSFIRSLNAAVRRIAVDLVEGRVGSHLHYAKYLEHGTGVYGPKGTPIVIVPKYKKALSWISGDGEVITRRRSVVRGMKPRAPFRKAIAAFMPRFMRIVAQELAKGGAR